MISVEQCRAARGLLNWTQGDLAKACHMSKTGINNYERGLSNIKHESLMAIQKAFEDAGILFTEGDGVRKRVDMARILKGDNALLELWDDIFDTLKNGGGEVLITNVDESKYMEIHPNALNSHLERLKQHHITERLLCCEGDTYFIQPVEYYRWVSKDLFNYGMSSYIYGDKVAFQLWHEAMVLLVDSPIASAAERDRFNDLWDSAQYPHAPDS